MLLGSKGLEFTSGLRSVRRPAKMILEDKSGARARLKEDYCTPRPLRRTLASLCDKHRKASDQATRF